MIFIDAVITLFVFLLILCTRRFFFHSFRINLVLKSIFHRFVYIKFTLDFENTFHAVQNNFVHFVINNTVYYVLYYRADFHLHSGCSLKHFLAIFTVCPISFFLSSLKLLVRVMAQSSGIILVLKDLISFHDFSCTSYLTNDRVEIISSHILFFAYRSKHITSPCFQSLQSINIFAIIAFLLLLHFCYIVEYIDRVFDI